jgi:hypothetical protein
MNKRSHEVSAAILIVLTVAATSVVSHAAEPSTWRKTATIEAPEAVQAAAADGRFVYAVSSTQVAKYDRATGERLAVSSGPAKHPAPFSDASSYGDPKCDRK